MHFPRAYPTFSLSLFRPPHSLSQHRTRISPSPTTLCSPYQLIKGAINQAQHSVFCACHAIWKSKRASSTNWSSRFAAAREAYLSVRAYVTHTHVIIMCAACRQCACVRHRLDAAGYVSASMTHDCRPDMSRRKLSKNHNILVTIILRLFWVCTTKHAGTCG